MTKLRINLMVTDVGKTIAYYQDVFDAEVLTVVPETAPYDFALMKAGDVEFMFELGESLAENLPQLQNKPMGGTFTLFIDVEDVLGLYEKVKDKVEIISEPHDTFYGTKEFYMADLNGYIIAFAQKM